MEAQPDVEVEEEEEEEEDLKQENVFKEVDFFTTVLHTHTCTQVRTTYILYGHNHFVNRCAVG